MDALSPSPPHVSIATNSCDGNTMHPRIWAHCSRSVLVNIPLDHVPQSSMYRHRVYAERQGRYAAFCAGYVSHRFTVETAFGEVHESWNHNCCFPDIHVLGVVYSWILQCPSTAGDVELKPVRIRIYRTRKIS
ncbi:hypothetical protein BKA82DRAFT_735381 [Pisolithus tinctorius]|uniref:Uncharacterized protein n=1 Tax=Pisolithus tinctorius Marx 270 TaxID=870435 RepID=A0A0C3JVL4_PISTI|nr:hypothetical protein BKA82DRAFT_735381 [Pisolithus tinctorius]KIO01482.1 hypothetical protein M404DRAFT_735381 [Pisolithus tinctorius Marx 270]